MKQKTILIMLCAMLLSGCGNSDFTDDALVIDFSGKTDIYVQTEQVVESKEEDAEYFYQFDEIDIYCYPDMEKILLDNHVDTKEFSWTAGPSRYADGENFLVGSFLNNGKIQLIYHPVIGTGTGVLVEELHIVDMETLEEYSVPDFVKEAESMVDMEALVNAEDLAGTENEVDLEKIFVGAYQYYQVEGDKIYVNLNVSVESAEELGTIKGVLKEKDGEIFVSEWYYVDAEAEQTVIDVANAYSQMYYETWQEWWEKVESDTTYEFAEAGSGFRYYKVKDGLITLQQIKERTEEICTEDYAGEEFYEKLLEKEGPLFFEQDGELYILEAEMPNLLIGDIKEVDILEKKEGYICAEIRGEDFALGETITDIVIVKEDGIWKVDSLESELKED